MDRFNRYLIDTERFSFGYDLSSWALPLKFEVGRANLYVQILCFDLSFYYGDDHGYHPVPATDLSTNRPFGDCGTAQNAIDFVLEKLTDLEAESFLRHWNEGNLDEYPEYYEWLKEKKP